MHEMGMQRPQACGGRSGSAFHRRCPSEADSGRLCESRDGRRHATPPLPHTSFCPGKSRALGGGATRGGWGGRAILFFGARCITNQTPQLTRFPHPPCRPAHSATNRGCISQTLFSLLFGPPYNPNDRPPHIFRPCRITNHSPDQKCCRQPTTSTNTMTSPSPNPPPGSPHSSPHPSTRPAPPTHTSAEQTSTSSTPARP